jgi:hypothetical protein
MRNQGDILLVGSVPLEDRDAVFKTCGSHVGAHVASIPDGETGDRTIWVVFQAYRVWAEHPQIETLQKPPAAKPDEGREDWMPTGLHDLWNFKVKDGVTDLSFDNLLYADVATESYEAFKKHREVGDIPKDVRFQVSLPLPRSAVSWFFRSQGEIARVLPAYTKALKHEVEKIANAIPAEDLAIQWDVCWEVLDIEGIFPWRDEGDAWEQYTKQIEEMTPLVPDGALMGIHLCYADLGHRHMKEPEDLGLVVEMANRATEVSTRRVDWFHIPVPRDRNDDAYFAPLRKLKTGDARIYLGLVHYTDGVEGTKNRLATAKKYLADFGIATECGFGRRPANTIPKLLDIHREAVI